MVAALFILSVSARAVDSSGSSNHSMAASDLARPRMRAFAASSAVERRATVGHEPDQTPVQVQHRTGTQRGLATSGCTSATARIPPRCSTTATRAAATGRPRSSRIFAITELRGPADSGTIRCLRRKPRGPALPVTRRDRCYHWTLSRVKEQSSEIRSPVSNKVQTISASSGLQQAFAS